MDSIEPHFEEGNQLPLSESNDMDDERSRTVFGSINEMGRLSTREEGQPKLRHWKILLFGQLIALVAASANACSFTLVYNLKVSLPMTEMCIMYLCLCSCYMGHVWKGGSLKEISTAPQDHARKYGLPLTRIRLHVPWWIYLCVALLDVEANYMTLLSFRYTSLMSTSLLGSLTIPSVMIVSWLLLNRVFRTPHYIGVFLCILGGTMTVYLDFDSVQSTELGHSHSYVGDVLAIGAALLYGLGDSLAEYSIKHLDRFEYLFMIGLFGALLCGIQAPFTEGVQLYQFIIETPTATQVQAIFGIAFYVAALLCYYISATLFLVHGDATLLVLSLQATQFWAILFSVVAEHHAPTVSFFVAVILMVVGVFIYEICGGQASLAIQNNEAGANEVRPLLAQRMTKEGEHEKALPEKGQPKSYCTVK